MTAAEFKKKWSRYQGKESAAYQEHFSDHCRILGQPTPVEADPSGNDCFCFQKRVVKGAEFLRVRQCRPLPAPARKRRIGGRALTVEHPPLSGALA